MYFIYLGKIFLLFFKCHAFQIYFNSHVTFTIHPVIHLVGWFTAPDVWCSNHPISFPPLNLLLSFIRVQWSYFASFFTERYIIIWNAVGTIWIFISNFSSLILGKSIPKLYIYICLLIWNIILIFNVFLKSDHMVYIHTK